MTLEHEHYLPDSLGELYGRVTELLGMQANAEEHKVQWLSVAGDASFTELFLDILSVSESGPRIDRSFFNTERLANGGLGPPFDSRLGLAQRRPVPGELRPPRAARTQR